MLEDSIQHVLLKHEVSTDQVLRQVLHSATSQPVRVWSAQPANQCVYGFLCCRLGVNQWHAVLTFVTGEPNDKMDVIIQGRDNGSKYRHGVEFHHSRE